MSETTYRITFDAERMNKASHPLVRSLINTREADGVAGWLMNISDETLQNAVDGINSGGDGRVDDNEILAIAMCACITLQREHGILQPEFSTGEFAERIGCLESALLQEILRRQGWIDIIPRGTAWDFSNDALVSVSAATYNAHGILKKYIDEKEHADAKKLRNDLRKL